MLKTEIALPEKYKKMIVQALVDALKEDVSDYVEEKQTYTYNGLPHIKWDFINTRLKDYLGNDEFFIRKIRKGFHHHVQVYHKESELMFAIVREYRYEDLKKDVSKPFNPPHYVLAYAQANDKIATSYSLPEQFEFDLGDIKNLHLDKLNLAKDQYNILVNDLVVQKFFLIIFEEKQGVVSSVKALLPSSVTLDELSPIEDWSEFISVFYEDVRFVDHFDEEDIEEDEDIVALKRDAYKEDGLKLKQHDNTEHEKEN